MTEKTASLKRTNAIKLVFHMAVLCIGAAIMLIPFVWMVLTSFKTYQETVAVPIVWLPSHWDLENYRAVLETLDFLRYYKNTIFVTLVTVTAMTFIASIASFAFARLDFPGKTVLFTVLLAVYMVPPQMTMVPKYMMIAKFGWVDTFRGVIIPNLFSVYTMFMLRQFFVSLPKDFDDAAKIDGCSYFRIYWDIDLPLIRNGLIAITVLNVLWAWNDLLWPLIATITDRKRVLSVAIATLQNATGTEYQILMAAGVLAVIPIFILYAVCQRYFMDGIATSGVKG